MPAPSLASSKVFVGRAPELDALIARLEETAAGRGGVVLLAGEPGIGKTRLAEELAAIAETRGVRVLWGRCYEGEGAPAFWPWVQVLRAAVRDAPLGALTQLGPAAAGIAQLVPEVAAQPDAGSAQGAGTAGAPSDLDPAQARFRLFDGITAFLGARAATQPHLLILDDLQWADTSSLLLLRFLAPNLRAMPLLVLGTYRDVEVGREHPLAAAFTAIARERGAGRIVLGGVPPEAVASWLAEARGEPVPASFAGALHELTSGNPFFIQETLRHLREVGLPAPIDRGADTAGADAVTAMLEVPEGVRGVIRQRLARLSRHAVRVLSVASVIGREFEVATAATVLEADGLPVIEALDEAEGARLVAAVPGSALRYRFTHDLIRETLYADLGRAAAVRLHHQVGEALERHYAQIEDRVSELAHHFVRAAPSGGVTKALLYARRAGNHALRQHAYDEAARWYEHALAVMSHMTPDDEATRCDLLLAQGRALLSAGHPRRVMDDLAPAALALAEALGEAGRARAEWACELALDGMVRYGGPGTLVGSDAFRAWAERIDRYAPPESSSRVYADTALGAAISAESLDQTLALYQRALAQARRLDDPDTLFYAALQLVNWGGGARHQAERLRLAEELTALPHTGVRPRNLGRLLWRAGAVLLDWGDRPRAEALWQQTATLAEQAREPELRLHGPMDEAILAVLDGRLDAALEAVGRLIELADALGSPAYGRRYALRLQERPLLLLGPAAAAPLTLPPELYALVGSDVWAPGNEAAAALRRAQACDFVDARRVLDGALPLLARDRDDANFPWHILGLLELAVLLEDREAVAALVERLAPLAPCATVDWGLTTPARHLGAAAALLGDRAAAQAYYEEALVAAERIRFRPEIALISLHLAELLADEPAGCDEARGRLRFALSEFRTMKMQPALDRALRLAERLGSSRPSQRRPNYPDGLTAREVEVLGLVATGATNREIAATLVVSPGTVHQHLVNIFAKIGARRRADAAAYATRHGLAPPVM
jgi:DNA-binding CsgD family transcriptional regulator